MTKDIYLTKEKLESLKEELDKLKTKRRPDVITKVKEALALGDLKENAEYHSAREELSYIEGRMNEISYMIKKAKIIKGSDGKGMIDVGSQVICSLCDSGDKKTFVIVGSAEVDVATNRISNESPIGQALLGKKKGEKIEVEIPSGSVCYKILDVK